MTHRVRILGLDPGLRHMGWGIVETQGSRLSFIACGTVSTHSELYLAERLAFLYRGLMDILKIHLPQEAAVEETFVNRDPQSALKLGQARGIALLGPAMAGLPVHEYAANKIKKTVVGVGHADKRQVSTMVGILLPACKGVMKDAADALAVAICHAHYRNGRDI